MTAASIERIVSRSGRTAADARRALESTSPQNRLIRVDEVAALVCFLAGDAAAGITGQAINVDGGAVMA
jgi:NAD(P)-dependent dehydrogenase (short-subunit alcohol dehydrogenase family)